MKPPKKHKDNNHIKKEKEDRKPDHDRKENTTNKHR